MTVSPVENPSPCCPHAHHIPLGDHLRRSVGGTVVGTGAVDSGRDVSLSGSQLPVSGPPGLGSAPRGGEGKNKWEPEGGSGQQGVPVAEGAEDRTWIQHITGKCSGVA